MYQFNDVVSLSTETKQALNLVNACLELMRGVEQYCFYDEKVVNDKGAKENVLDYLQNACTSLRYELGLAIENALTDNPPKEFDLAEVII